MSPYHPEVMSPNAEGSASSHLQSAVRGTAPGDAGAAACAAAPNGMSADDMLDAAIRLHESSASYTRPQQPQRLLELPPPSPQGGGGGQVVRDLVSA